MSYQNLKEDLIYSDKEDEGYISLDSSFLHGSKSPDDSCGQSCKRRKVEKYLDGVGYAEASNKELRKFQDCEADPKVSGFQIQEIQMEDITIKKEETKKDLILKISLSLKESLIKNLEELKPINTMLRFTRLLIEAKDAIEKDKGINSSTCSESVIEIKIFSELKSIVMDHEFHNTFVKSLQKVLHISTDECSPLLSVLHPPIKSEFDSSETSRKYLTTLIKSMEDLITACESKLYLFRNKKLLLQLLSSLVRLGSLTAENVLHFIAEIFKLQVKLSNEDKEKIGVLMVGALEHIRTRIKFVPSFSMFKPLTDHLQMRSALQFIEDNFATFPTGEGKSFKDHMDEIKTIIRDLDQMLKILYLPDPSDDEDDCQEGGNIYLGSDGAFEPVRLQMKADMPDDHIWWELYRQIYF